MLKKLVKYGNSNAIILDKALLELLNMTEGMVVKIKTDGTSLIITPQHANTQENISKTITPQEVLQEATQQCLAQSYGSVENALACINEIKNVSAKYPEAMKTLEATGAAQAFQEVEQRFNNNHSDPEYIRAILALRQKYTPELRQINQINQEIQTISKKYVATEYQYPEDKIVFAMENYKKVHEKYKHLLEAVVNLNDNPDYINESVLLAEKYEATKSSAEYMEKYNQLISKYIPEYADYQRELKVISESLK